MPYYDQAFRAYGGSLPPGDYRFGGLFNNMALAWEDLGEYRKAEAYYKKAHDLPPGPAPFPPPQGPFPSLRRAETGLRLPEK